MTDSITEAVGNAITDVWHDVVFKEGLQPSQLEVVGAAVRALGLVHVAYTMRVNELYAKGEND